MSGMNLWAELAGAALVGTARGENLNAATNGKTNAPLSGLVAHLQATLAPEDALLAAAGAAVLHQQIGWLPEQISAEDTTEPMISDDRPPIERNATYFLERLLNQERPELLPEFLGVIARSGRRVPQEQLPPLLEQGAKVPRLRPLIFPIVSEHGRRLAALNPAWHYAAVDMTDWRSLRSHWQQADLNGRRALLTYLRDQDAANGRQLLESTWKSDPDATRRDLIRSLEKGLSMSDEPFLERALDDRDVTVRRKAAELLAALPDSRLCQRMITNAAGILAWTPCQTTQVSGRFPPTIIDPLVRDGVVRPEAAEPTTNERTRMLIHIVSAIPLAHWSAAWDVGPAAIVRGVQTSKWPRTLMTALATAALRQRNLEWAKLLLAQDGYGDRTGRLIAILPADVSFAEIEKRLTTADGRPLTADNPVLRFLRYWPHEWDAPTSRLWIDFLVGQAGLDVESKATPTLRYQMRQLVRQCAPEVADYAAEVFSTPGFNDAWRQAFKTFLGTMAFRKEMLAVIENE